MSSSTVFKVPEGMSCVNAFHALWESSKPAVFLMYSPALQASQATTVATAEKVADLFKDHTYFDYEGGRMLKIDFASFPILDARAYDKDLGAGAAQKAIEAYNKIDPSVRFDKNDSCKFEDLRR